MADLAPSWDVGQALVEFLKQSFKCASLVTKGRVVAASGSVLDEYPTIADAGADSVAPLGVALRSGAAGEVIPVLMIGIVKVNNVGAITVGECVKCAANGAVQAMPVTKVAGEEEKVVGRALQTSTGDGQMLILVGVI